jgi:hypothetical protein
LKKRFEIAMRNRTIRAAIILASCALLAGCAAADPAEHARQMAAYYIFGSVALVAGLAAMVLVAGWLSQQSAKRKRELMIGAPPRRRIGDWAFAGQAPLESLIPGLHSRRGDVRAEVAVELCRRLPAEPHGVTQLPQNTRRWLYRALDSRDPELSFAILEVAIRGRDVIALPYVERLSRQLRRRPASALAERAGDCAEALRRVGEAPAARLLRPAGEEDGDALLRSAVTSGSSAPELLLRSGDAREE